MSGGPAGLWGPTISPVVGCGSAVVCVRPRLSLAMAPPLLGPGVARTVAVVLYGSAVTGTWDGLFFLASGGSPPQRPSQERSPWLPPAEQCSAAGLSPVPTVLTALATPRGRSWLSACGVVAGGRRQLSIRGGHP